MCKCWSQWLLIAVIFSFSAMTLLTGCGIKGPLYHPEDKKQHAQDKPEEQEKTKPITKEK